MDSGLNGNQEPDHLLASGTRVGAEEPEKVHKRDPPSPSLWSNQKFQRIANEWWLLEVTSCAGSVLALAAIVIFLKIYDGRVQQEWPHNITPNSVISWFATFMKALMLVPIAACISQARWIHFQSKTHILNDLAIFDAASRGPMGSLQLLGKFWQRRVACLGALITVLSFGINPMLQQLITIRTRPVDSTAQASLGRAQTFLQADEPATIAMSADDSSIPMPDMIGAMFQGIFFKPGSSNASTLDMSASCSTGNCTFPPFQSLAVGSTCEDLTDRLSHTCGKSGTYCEHRLPNGLSVNKSHNSGVWSSMTTSGYFGTVGPVGYGNSFFNFSMVTTDGLERSLEKGATATQCHLYWCVNTYESSVINGQLHEHVRSSWHSNTTEWVDPRTMNSKRLELVPPPLTINSSQPTFTVAYLSTNALSVWLRRTLSVSNTISTSSDGNSFHMSGNGSSDTASMQIIRNFQNTKNMSTLFQNIGRGITRNVRNQNFTAQTPDRFIPPVQGVGAANGTATYLEIYMHVQWGWLAFPIALLGLTVVFLASTMIDTARCHIPAWKSSPLSLLFHGLEGETSLSERLKLINDVTEMERLAEEIDVRFTDSGNGLGLLVNAGLHGEKGSDVILG